jgi:hypothetical protein
MRSGPSASAPSAYLGHWRGACPPTMLSPEHSAPPIEGGILVGTRLRCHVEREMLKTSVRLKKACAVSGVASERLMLASLSSTTAYADASRFLNRRMAGLVGAQGCVRKIRKANPSAVWTAWALVPDSRPLTILVQFTNTIKTKHQCMDLLTNTSAGPAQWSQQLRSNILDVV